MAHVKEEINTKTMSNFKIAQAKDKVYYNKKHANSKVTATFIIHKYFGFTDPK